MYKHLFTQPEVDATNNILLFWKSNFRYINSQSSIQTSNFNSFKVQFYVLVSLKSPKKLMQF